jgi:hypothetical protein
MLFHGITEFLKYERTHTHHTYIHVCIETIALGNCRITVVEIAGH